MQGAKGDFVPNKRVARHWFGLWTLDRTLFEPQTKCLSMILPFRFMASCISARFLLTNPWPFFFFVTSSIAFFFYIFNALCCFWGEINLRVAVTHVLLPVVQERKQEIPVCRWAPRPPSKVTYQTNASLGSKSPLSRVQRFVSSPLPRFSALVLPSARYWSQSFFTQILQVQRLINSVRAVA